MLLLLPRPLLGAKAHRLIAMPQHLFLRWRAGSLWSGHGRHAVLQQLDGAGHVVTFVCGVDGAGHVVTFVCGMAQVML